MITEFPYRTTEASPLCVYSSSGTPNRLCVKGASIEQLISHSVLVKPLDKKALSRCRNMLARRYVTWIAPDENGHDITVRVSKRSLAAQFPNLTGDQQKHLARSYKDKQIFASALLAYSVSLNASCVQEDLEKALRKTGHLDGNFLFRVHYCAMKHFSQEWKAAPDFGTLEGGYENLVVRAKDNFVVCTDELLGKGSFKEVYRAVRVERLEDQHIFRVSEVARQHVFRDASRAIIEDDFAKAVQSTHVLGASYFRRLQNEDSADLIVDLLEYDLSTVLKGERSLSYQQLCYILRGAALGLVDLHASGCVHCDVKAANVMLRRKEGVVIDLGLSHRLGSKSSTACGTLSHCSPEVLDTDTAYHPARDVWAFAVMTYRLLHPDHVNPGFQRGIDDTNSFVWMLDSLVQSEVEHELFLGWPAKNKHEEALQSAIQQAFAVNPSERLTMEDFAAALDGAPVPV